MALPEQVRKQSEAISKYYEDNSADEAAATADTSGDDLPSDEEANGAAAPAPEPARNEQTRTGTNEETAEQRYRTLQGMYNADTARLRTDKQELTARVEQLERLLSSLSASSAQQNRP